MSCEFRGKLRYFDMATAFDSEAKRTATKVALLYYHLGVKQSEIAKRFGLSQTNVSRLLSLARTLNIVRISVVTPEGLYSELEMELENTYGLRGVHIAQVSDEDNEAKLIGDLGKVAATLLPSLLRGAKTVGLTSWSRSLREAIAGLNPQPDSEVEFVVEMLGDVGEPALQHEAAQSTTSFASLLGAQPLFLRVPGVSTNIAIRETLMANDANALRTLRYLNDLDVALVGIAGCKSTVSLGPEDNFFTKAQFDYAISLGAVGQVDLRFINENGDPVTSELDSLLIGVTLEQLRNAKRSIGVAGGKDKYESIRAIIRGKWIDTLITDVSTAQWLIANA